MGLVKQDQLFQQLLKYNNLDLYKEKEKLLFDKITIALKDIEQDYNIKISDDEVAYIVKIITTKK